MSIASRITEIETHIGDVYDTINYSYDTTGINKNIINIPKYLKKGYIDIINNGIDTLYNNFPKVSGIGSNLSLAPTYEAPMKLNEIQGDTLQENTPTPDTPVPIQSVTGLQNVEVCGKNLWSVGDKTDVGWASNYVDIKDLLNSLKEGTYSMTLNFKVTEIVKEKTNNQYGFAFYNSNRHITNKINTNSNINVDDNFVYTYTFTISSSQVGNFTNAYFYGFGNDTDNVTAKSLMYDCQLELGSSSTSYEPYKGNTYEVNLGKNLFSSEMELGTLNNSTGLPATETNCIRTKDYISVNPNTTYIISNNKGYQQIVYQYDSSYNLIVANTQNSSFTTTSTTKYIKLRTGVSNVENDLTSLWQLEKGTQATSYSPYFTPIELNKISTYEDRIYKDNGKWYLYKDFDKYTITGNEKISVFEVTSNGCFAVNLGIKCRNAVYSGSTTYWLATTLKPYSLENLRGSSPNIGICVLDDNYTYINLTAGASTLANVTTLFANLAGTDVYYLKQNPTTTEITNTELIEDLETLYTAKSQEGTTNISITSEDLEMILNVSALKGDA